MASLATVPGSIPGSAICGENYNQVELCKTEDQTRAVAYKRLKAQRAVNMGIRMKLNM